MAGVKTTRGAVRLSVLWGDRVLDVRHVPRDAVLTAGELLGPDVGAANLAPATPLFGPGGALENLGRQQVGALVLAAEVVAAPPRVGTITPPEDYGFFKIASMVGLTVLAALVCAWMTHPPFVESDEKVPDAISRVVKNAAVPILNVKPLPAPSGEAAAKKEGKTGKPEAKKEHTAAPKGSGPMDKRQKVMGTGLLAAVNELGGMGQVLGGGGANGWNTALGNLKGGTTVGDQRGTGWGSRGGDVGGGGPLSLGGIGTLGGHGPGGTGLDTNVHPPHHVTPGGGQVRVEGGLSKEEIARVIKRHQSEIKYCYESELQRNPDLSGKVAVLFTIDPAGAISDADVSESTLANTSAESCILSKVKRWKFPEPQGGGVVTVNFPWVFSAAGSNAENE